VTEQDERRAAEYARRMAAYRDKLAAERRTERFAWTGDEVLHLRIKKADG
jgi:cytochrome P450